MLCAIPIEIANRELDGVIYLALHLAKQGMSTLFGERMVNEYVFRLNAGKPVIYFDQDQNVEMNRKVLHSGGVVFNLSAEGQNLDTNPGVVDLFAKAACSFSAMFVRGEEQRKAVVNAFSACDKDKVMATGQPAFDLLQHRFLSYHERPDIVSAYGRDYILINTQFGAFNHKMGFDDYLRMVAKLKEWKDLYEDAEFIEFLYAQRDEQERVARKFVSLARSLASEFPERAVIIRPHPTEGIDFYAKSLSGVDNLHVKYDGPVMPWLASAGAVVHYSCTTGVEAFLMGKKVVRYDPFGTGGENTMQARIGLAAEDEGGVAALIREGVMSEEERKRQMDLIRPYAANCDKSAAAAIAEHAARYVEEPEWKPAPLSPWESMKCWRKYFSKLLRMHQPGRNGRKVRYAYEKFPRLPVKDVADRVERLRSCEPGLPEVRLVQLGLNVFSMEPKQGTD